MPKAALNHKQMRRVYVFSIPVRLYHWLNAGSMLVLFVTGYLIGNPPAIVNGAEASFSYWFGTVRFLHFASAFIFFFNFMFRIYWGFVGNKWETWKNFIPSNKKFIRELIDIIKMDVLFIKNKNHVSIGHNALAGFSYFILFLVFLFESFTGFALYANMSEWWFPKMFTWITPLMGSEFDVRFWHHLTMWFFVIFTIIHVYLVFYHDYIEGRGEISSMGGGWKFIEEECIEKEECEEIDAR